MTGQLFSQLEDALEHERQAMLSGDWQTLQGCVDRKRQLADQLAQLEGGEVCWEDAERIRQATLHNATLASALSRRVNGLLSGNRLQPIYNRGGRAKADYHRPLVSLRM